MTYPENCYLCLTCRTTVSAQEAKVRNLNECPNCGSIGIPADTNHVETIVLTAHELRCLTMWAENWANVERSEPNEMARVVYGIIDAIQPQVQYSQYALSMQQELAGLRETFGEIETNYPEPPK